MSSDSDDNDGELNEDRSHDDDGFQFSDMEVLGIIGMARKMSIKLMENFKTIEYMFAYSNNIN